MLPHKHQMEGAVWLAAQKRALLADEPRVGKTGTAIMALDIAGDRTALIVTTSSGRAVWRRAIKEWSFSRNRYVEIVAWADLLKPKTNESLLRRKWDRLILDESHAAKNYDAKRTQAVYGKPSLDGLNVDFGLALCARAKGVWCLTGTPAPNSLLDLYPMLRALAPERLAEGAGGPNVSSESMFRARYCITRYKQVGPWTRVPVVIGSRYEAELHKRLTGFMLRRTQKDVGLSTPIYETFPLAAQKTVLAQVRALLADVVKDKISASDMEDPEKLKAAEPQLAEIRRLTGIPKAEAVVGAVKEELDNGLDKIVLAYWHKDVGDILEQRLGALGVVRLDGSTSARDRASAEQRFRDAKTRVFLGQIQAAGEAIDLSAAAELLFVEQSMTPAHMKQMAMRIVNHTQTRIPRVRVATLEGSIDDALSAVLLRKWSSINEVVK